MFLAPTIGLSGHDPSGLVTGIANMTPGARRQARFGQFDYMTRVADEALGARRLGKRAATRKMCSNSRRKPGPTRLVAVPRPPARPHYFAQSVGLHAVRGIRFAMALDPRLVVAAVAERTRVPIAAAPVVAVVVNM